MSHNTQDQEICCPEFHPEPWDRKTHQWVDKLFLKDSMRTFLHMPNPKTVGKVVGRMYNLAKSHDAAPELDEFIMMANDPSAFRSDYYMNLTKEIPGANTVKMTGEFYSRVFDGPYNAVPKWIRELQAEAKSMNKKFVDYYFYYTTCPGCAKKYGHNYVVAFAKIQP
jgi:hypothetical protein